MPCPYPGCKARGWHETTIPTPVRGEARPLAPPPPSLRRRPQSTPMRSPRSRPLTRVGFSVGARFIAPTPPSFPRKRESIPPLYRSAMERGPGGEARPHPAHPCIPKILMQTKTYPCEGPGPPPPLQMLERGPGGEAYPVVPHPTPPISPIERRLTDARQVKRTARTDWERSRHHAGHQRWLCHPAEGTGP